MARTIFDGPFVPPNLSPEHEPAWPNGSRPGTSLEEIGEGYEESPLSPSAREIIAARKRVAAAIDDNPPSYN